MHAKLSCRWLLLGFLVVSPCFLASYARRGGGGSRGSSSSRGSSYSRPSPSYSRPSPSYSRPSPSYSRPSPSYSRPAPAPAPRPAPAPAPKPAPAPAPKPAPPVRQPAYNPNFKEPSPGFGAGDRQPAYNPNYKPAGPPPPYSPTGHLVPSAPVGPPPPYQSSNQLGQQPPPFRGRPPAYPGLESQPRQPELNRPYVIHPGIPGIHQSNGPKPYPVQPGFPGPNQPNSHKPYPVQPGVHQPNMQKPYPVQPGVHQPNMQKPYPVQPGVHQPNTHKPYPVQPGVHQPNTHKPYPVQPGFHNPYPGVNRPYPTQSLGGNVWQPHHGMPAPSYMNYGGIPTGTNMYTKPHKKKGFLGSLMSLGKNKSGKKNKYYGSIPSPYGVGSSGTGHGVNSFLGKHHSSPAMYTIFPYMVAKKAHKIHRPKFGFMPMYYGGHYRHYHHYHHYSSDGDINPEYASYFDVYDDNYVGKCQKPLKKKNSQVDCSATFDELQCTAKCEEGYRYPNDTKSITNKCWHVTGVWKPKKNFPDCIPVCNNKCLNGGQCVGPEVCKCPAEYRGNRCQFHFLNCNILRLVKDQNLGWVCKHSKNETVCHVRCKSTIDFDQSQVFEYRCTPEGVWKPDNLPECEKSS